MWHTSQATISVTGWLGSSRRTVDGLALSPDGFGGRPSAALSGLRPARHNHRTTMTKAKITRYFMGV